MYKNSDLSPEQRAKDLLSKMNLDEKINEMNLHISIEDLANDIKNGKKPELRGGCFGQAASPETVEIVQKYYMENSRLGIPILYAFEGLHGVIGDTATVFPQSAGLGGAFNRELIYKMAQTIGSEAEGLGIRQIYAPNVDIPRDPRWGRMQECYGEDTYLVGELGAQYVKGIQDNNVASTVKHFISYCVPEGGINLAPVHIGEREMREVFLEPFKKCIDAGVLSVMPAYNEIDGVPVHASKKLLQDLLRGELGFKGMTITDYGAIDMLKNFHRVAPDELTAGIMSLEAGLDMEAPEPFGYGEALKKAVIDKKVDMALIDRAVYNILVLKFKTGIFDQPFPNKEKLEKINNDDAKKLALELDEQSILLLKNDGILPLDENKLSKVAVIGNNAKNSFLGNYVLRTNNCIDFCKGMEQRLGKDRVLYSQGCTSLYTSDELVEHAVETAKNADVVFLVLGDNTEVGGGVGGVSTGETAVTCGEGFDTHDLNMTNAQKRVFDAVSKTGKPVVLIMYAGRPYTIKDQVDKVNAYMHSWGGSEQSGIAFANLIFGDKSPSAKLTISFPQTTGHLPCYYNHKPSARGSFYKKPGSIENPGRDYILASPDAWFTFGYGLSYTKLEYSNLKADVKDGKVYISVDIENKGNYDIYESVLLFVKAHYCPVTPFVKKLRSFEKVYIKKGEKATVNFVLTDEDFMYIDFEMKKAKNKGRHSVIIENLEVEFDVD